MWNFRRLHGMLVPVVILAAILGALSLPLSLTLGRDPLRFVGSDRMTFTLVSHQAAGSAISATLEQVRNPRNPVGILVGSSTLECGVDPSRVGVRGTIPRRWLSLFGRGSTGSDLEGMANLCFEDGVRPELVVLALDPGMWVQCREHLADIVSNDLRFDSKQLATHLAAHQWRAVAGDARAELLSISNTLFPCRKRVNNRLQYAIFLARTALLRSAGQGSRAIYSPATDPWNPHPDWANGPHATNEQIHAQMDGYSVRKWFSREAYDVDGENIASLVRLIRKAHSARTKVALVVMPETTAIRDTIPREALPCLSEGLERALGADAPPLIDLRDAMADEFFLDLTHLDPEGRRIFTARLSKVLEERFGTAPRREDGLASRR